MLWKIIGFGESFYTETENSFWQQFSHWLRRKFIKWQLLVQPVMKISSKWEHLHFSVLVTLGNINNLTSDMSVLMSLSAPCGFLQLAYTGYHISKFISTTIFILHICIIRPRLMPTLTNGTRTAPQSKMDMDGLNEWGLMAEFHHFSHTNLSLHGTVTLRVSD